MDEALLFSGDNMDTNIAIVIVCAVCVGAVLGVLAVGLVQRLAEREEA